MKIEHPIDLSTFEIQNVRLHHIASLPAALTGQIAYIAATVNRPVWSDGVEWHQIHPPAIAGLRDGFVLSESGIATIDVQGNLYGIADLASSLVAPISVSVTGKATASAVLLQNSGQTAVLNVTALSGIVASEIALTSGRLLRGNGSNIAAEVQASSIGLHEWGPPSTEVSFNSKRITNLADPIADADAANKGWVEGIVGGRSPKDPVRLATAAALATFTASATPATLTASANAVLTVDGVTPSVGDRILVKSETGLTQKYNGVYTVSAVGVADPGGAPWVLARASDANSDAEVTTGDAYFVTAGSTNGGTTWALQTAEPLTLDTTPLTFVQIAGGAQYSAGKGIVQAGGVFHFARSTPDYPTYGIPLATGPSTIGFSSAPTAHQVFRAPGDGSAPDFGAINLASSAAVTGTLAGANGGTGFNSYTAGDLLYAASTGSALSKLAAAVAGNVLLSGTTPSWGKVNLGGTIPVHVTGVLQPSYGGLGVSTITPNAVLYGNGASAIQSVVGLPGQLLQPDAGAVPKFVTVSGDATIAVGGAVTIGENKVTFAKMQDVASGVVAGRLAAGPGDMRELTIAELTTAILGSGSFTPTVTLSGGDVTGSGPIGAVNAVISGLAFTKLQNGSAYSVLGVVGGIANSVASIAATAADQVFRMNSTGNGIGFGAINLAGANATTGVLPVAKGGTGTSTANVFPTVAGLIPRLRKIPLVAGSTSYVVPHGYGNAHVIAGLVDSGGMVIYARITIDSTNVTVVFGSATTKSYTLILCGSNLADPV